jgi:hypothetical protein
VRRPVQVRFPRRDVLPLRVAQSPVSSEEVSIALRRNWLNQQAKRLRKRVQDNASELQRLMEEFA